MIVTPDHRALEFILQDGWLYREKGDRVSTNTEFVRMGFGEYRKVLDLSSFKMNKTNDSAFRTNYQMLTMKELQHNIDSLNHLGNTYKQRAAGNMQTILKFSRYLDTTGWTPVEKDPNLQSAFLLTPKNADSTRRRRDFIIDSVNQARGPHAPQDRPNSPGHPTSIAAATPPGQGAAPSANQASKQDSARASGKPSPSGKEIKPTVIPAKDRKPPTLTFYDYLPDTTRFAVLDRSISTLNGLKTNLDQPSYLFEAEQDNLHQHEIAWHEKLTLAIACLVMFLIGAPLGSIIRKGGIGLPLVFAVVFFVIFFLLNNFGKKFVKQDVLTPIAGMWMATYVLTPVGLFLTYKALHDSQLFNKEYYFRIIKKIRSFIRQRRNRKESAPEV